MKLVDEQQIKSRKFLRTVLSHEMCHANFRSVDHGDQFQTCLNRFRAIVRSEMNLFNSIIRWLSEVFSTPGRAVGVLIYVGTFIALVVGGWLVLTFLISQFWE